jgi:tetratricopeptide (TPR) repeat protein
MLSLATLVLLAASFGIRRRFALSIFRCSAPPLTRTGWLGPVAPVFVAVAIVIVSWTLDVGGWRADQEASSIEASATRAWSEEALAASRAGAHGSAELLLERALELRPDAVTWHRLGIVRRAMGERAASREAFERALAIDPTFEPARAALSEFRVSPEAGSGS